MMQDSTVEHQGQAVQRLTGLGADGTSDKLDYQATVLLHAVAPRGAEAQRIRDHAIMLCLKHPNQKRGMVVRDETGVMHRPCQSLRLVAEIHFVHHREPLVIGAEARVAHAGCCRAEQRRDEATGSETAVTDLAAALA